MINILVVEDDKKFNRIVCAHLAEQGYNVIGRLSAVEAFDRMIDNIIDLIISDIMMPEVDGFKFASMIREQDKVIPLLFITARDELTLRVGALLRRANIANEKKLTAGSLVLNADKMTATVAGEEIPVTVREFNVLFKLLSYPKKTFTRNQLLDDFWGAENDSAPRTVDVYITKLREKFAACKDFEILTVHRLGYKAVLK
jgi:DNA-binding response OmpR family regulator